MDIFTFYLFLFRWNLEIWTECLLCAGASFHLPNVATGFDGCIVVMYKNIPVLKYLGVVGHQANNSQIVQEGNSSLYYMYNFSVNLKFFFNRRKDCHF